LKTSSKTAAAAVAVMFALAGCGGGGGGKSASPDTPIATFDGKNVDPGNLGVTGKPLPKVSAQQVKSLVGTWLNTTKNNPVQDSFVFNADGTGTWQVQAKILWNGQVIPAGTGAYRLSWKGLDPNEASFWAIKLTDSGATLVFQGNQQTYKKAARKTPVTGKTP